MQNLPVIASESEEKFDFSLPNVAAGVKICNTLDILEEISDYQSEPFSPHDLDLPSNSCRIACTKIQNFEEEENCASTVSVDHNFGYDMKLIVSDIILFVFDLILFGSIFQVHELSVLLVVSFIKFGVTNQVPQVSFKIPTGDSISLLNVGSDMNIFGSDLFSDMIIFGSVFKI